MIPVFQSPSLQNLFQLQTTCCCFAVAGVYQTFLPVACSHYTHIRLTITRNHRFIYILTFSFFSFFSLLLMLTAHQPNQQAWLFKTKQNKTTTSSLLVSRLIIA